MVAPSSRCRLPFVTDPVLKIMVSVGATSPMGYGLERSPETSANIKVAHVPFLRGIEEQCIRAVAQGLMYAYMLYWVVMLKASVAANEFRRCQE